MDFSSRLFNDDDRGYLKNELQKQLGNEYDDVKATNFIENLEIHCHQMKMLMELPSPSVQAGDLKAILKNIKKCIGLLEDLPRKHPHFWWVGLSRNFYDVDFGPDLHYEEKYQLVQKEKTENDRRKALLKQTSNSLEAICELIEQEIYQDLKTGRPKGDGRNFAYAVGKLLWIQLSIKPKTTRTGLFAAVLSMAWKALGQKKEYPPKEISDAVQKFNKVFP